MRRRKVACQATSKESLYLSACIPQQPSKGCWNAKSVSLMVKISYSFRSIKYSTMTSILELRESAYPARPIKSRVSSRRNEVIADFGWVHSNEGKTFVGYVPVTYERDIHVKRGDSPKEVITAGCSVSEGVDHAKRIYIRGIYPNKDEALDFLHKHSTGSRVTVFWEEGERVYRVREDMLEVGFFRVSDSYVPWYDAELVEHLDYEAFQPGQVESGSY